MKITLLISLLFLTTQVLAVVDHEGYVQMSAKDKVNYLWSRAYDDEEGLDPVFYYSFVKELDSSSLSVSDKLKLQKLESFFGNKTLKFESIENLTYEDALTIVSEKEKFLGLPLVFSSEAKSLLERAELELTKVSQFEKLTKEEILDIFENENGFSSYQSGRYADGVKLFLFCRHNRIYPCRFVIKDRHNQIIRNDDGSLWTLPGLAYSRRKLPFNITNGQTPQGIHSMDSVMPTANNPKAYGQWRRVILNWIPKSSDESLTRSLLPNSSLDKNWWKQASIARDVGRKFLRIHGTGNRNDNKTSPHYTFFGTSGCISTQENTYDGVEYKGQRILLDKLMQAMNLLPVYSNEIKIKGLLYVIELDDDVGAVTEDVLSRYGIE